MAAERQLTIDDLARMNREREEHAKELGKARAAQAKRQLLERARMLARVVARRHPERLVTADDVQAALAQDDPEYTSKSLGNAAGSIFSGEEFVSTGRYAKSQRDGSHANPILIWRYTGV